MLVPSRSPHWLPGSGARIRSPGATRSGFEAAVAGRAAAREEAHAVGVRPVAVRGADRDHAVGVAGVGDAERGVALEQALGGLEVLVAAVAGGGDHDDAAVDEALALVADRRAAARVVADVVRDREAQVRAVDRHVAVALVDVADVLERGDDRELGLLQRRRQHAEVVELDVRAHAVRPVGRDRRSAARLGRFRLRSASGLGRALAGRRAEDAGHVRAVVGRGRTLAGSSSTSCSTSCQLIERPSSASSASCFEVRRPLPPR